MALVTRVQGEPHLGGGEGEEKIVRSRNGLQLCIIYMYVYIAPQRLCKYIVYKLYGHGKVTRPKPETAYHGNLVESQMSIIISTTSQSRMQHCTVGIFIAGYYTGM